MNLEQLKELLLQSVEHEACGVQVYQTALKCAVNEELKEEWERYLEETTSHEQILRSVCVTLEVDPDEETPGREIVRSMGESLVSAMEEAADAGKPEAAQLVA